MKMFRLAILFASFATSTAFAQSPTPFVAIRDLTVEGRDPPDSLRDALADGTGGVMHGFDVCYARRHALAGPIAGELSFRLWVSALQVIRVTPEGATFTDDELVRCMKQRLLEFRLPPDAPRAGVTVRFTVGLTPPQDGNAIVCTMSSCSAVPCGSVDYPCCPTLTCTGAGLVCEDTTCVAPPAPPPPPTPTITVDVTRSRGGMTVDDTVTAFPSSLFASCLEGVPSGSASFSVSVSRTGTVRASVLSGANFARTVTTCLRGVMASVRLAAKPRATTARLTIRVSP